MAHPTDRRKTAYRKKLQNRTSMTLIMLIVVILLLVVGIKGYGLITERNRLQEEYAANEETIQELKDEQVEIEKKEKRKQTNEYIEEEAREMFNFVNENDLLLTPEKSN